MKFYSIIGADNHIDSKKALEPHIFSVAASSFWQLKENKIKQAIVISGESGAGKTVSAKYAMKFLTNITTLAKGKSLEEKEKEH